MKILHTSDWHIDQLNGWGNHNLFQNYHLDKIEEMVDKAIKDKVNLFIFAGDLYKNSSSNFKVKDKINQSLIKMIKKLEKNNIEAVFISGNHDIRHKSISNKDNNLSLFHTIEYDNLFTNSPSVDKIEYKDYIFNKNENLRVVLFPYLKNRNKEDIKNDLKNIVKEAKDKVIIIGHLDVLGATYGKIEIQNLDTNNVNVWTPKELESFNSDLVLLGHIHNSQTLGKLKKVIYCGSPYKLSFSEEDSEKGYYIHELKNDNKITSTFTSSNDRNWKTFRYDYTKNNLSFHNLLEVIKESTIENNVVRIIFEGIESKDYKFIPYKEIKDLLLDKKIMLFRGFSYKEIKHKMTVLDKTDENYGKEIILEKLDPKEIFNSILKKNKEDKSTVEKANRMLEEIMNELEENL